MLIPGTVLDPWRCLMRTYQPTQWMNKEPNKSSHWLSGIGSTLSEPLFLCYKIKTMCLLCRPIGRCENKHMGYFIQCLVHTRCFRSRNFDYYRVKSQTLALPPPSSKGGMCWWGVTASPAFSQQRWECLLVLFSELAVSLMTEPCSLISLWQPCPLVPQLSGRKSRENWVYRAFACQGICKWIR